ncbi:hypothetical protein CF54_03825 [Streptomyces sp. Tu 6176]|nr:hypothetical protein CF54_03825 [Streptomyces sp. Tu 6176]
MIPLELEGIAPQSNDFVIKKSFGEVMMVRVGGCVCNHASDDSRLMKRAASRHGAPWMPMREKGKNLACYATSGDMKTRKGFQRVLLSGRQDLPLLVRLPLTQFDTHRMKDPVKIEGFTPLLLESPIEPPIYELIRSERSLVLYHRGSQLRRQFVNHIGDRSGDKVADTLRIQTFSRLVQHSIFNCAREEIAVSVTRTFELSEHDGPLV